MQYLLFQLYGPMASWGLPATGEARRSAGHPGRAALIGLLAAALGIRRDDTDKLNALGNSVQCAVKQIASGMMINDYHTIQAPSRDKKARWRTRRDELAYPNNKLNTILSTREYCCDGYWRVALSATADAAYTLEALAAALQRPRFSLYLGRKACPLGAPLAPAIISADGIRDALSRPFPALTPLDEQREQRHLGITDNVAYAWEGAGGDIEADETRYPYDEPLDRTRWQFTSRAEHWARRKEST